MRALNVDLWDWLLLIFTVERFIGSRNEMNDRASLGLKKITFFCLFLSPRALSFMAEEIPYLTHVRKQN